MSKDTISYLETNRFSPTHTNRVARLMQKNLKNLLNPSTPGLLQPITVIELVDGTGTLSIGYR